MKNNINVGVKSSSSKEVMISLVLDGDLDKVEGRSEAREDDHPV